MSLGGKSGNKPISWGCKKGFVMCFPKVTWTPWKGEKVKEERLTTLYVGEVEITLTFVARVFGANEITILIVHSNHCIEIKGVFEKKLSWT